MSKEWYVGEIRDTVKRAEKMSKYGLHGFTPAILSVAITGGMHSKNANPNLPESIDEQVQQVYDAYNAGAVMVHIHARRRDALSEMSFDTNDYMEINARVRKKCPDIIINNTFVGARMFYKDKAADQLWQVSAPARPEVASLDICRNLYDFMPDIVYAQTLGDCRSNIEMLDKYGCKPEVECFDLGDIQFLNKMIQYGMLKAPYWVQMIFNSSGITPCLETLMMAEKLLPADAMMGIIGIGAVQTPLAAASMILGHHVRTGLEDNVYYSKGVLAESNAQLVERTVRIARDLGRPLATPAQAREMMGLGEPRQYALP
ncbi:MAG: 3-keto-5-aminohexanoate cleavage protein [Oscillospiraceae bacterium]